MTPSITITIDYGLENGRWSGGMSLSEPSGSGASTAGQSAPELPTPLDRVADVTEVAAGSAAPAPYPSLVPAGSAGASGSSGIPTPYTVSGIPSWAEARAGDVAPTPLDLVNGSNVVSGQVPTPYSIGELENIEAGIPEAPEPEDVPGKRGKK